MEGTNELGSYLLLAKKIGHDKKGGAFILRVRNINEDNFDNNFKEAVERQIDVNVNEKLIQKGFFVYSISQIEVREAIKQ